MPSATKRSFIMVSRTSRLPGNSLVVFPLAADRVELDSLPGDLGRRQPAFLGLLQDIPQRGGKIAGRADDRVAHRDVLQSARQPDAFVAILEPVAQAFRLALTRRNVVLRRRAR